MIPYWVLHVLPPPSQYKHIYNIHNNVHATHTQARKVTKELYSQEGCHPLKMALLPWVQLPLWIVISFALRNMTGSYPGANPPADVLQAFQVEGTLWFPDLTLPDPYVVLPLLLVATNLLNIEVSQTFAEFTTPVTCVLPLLASCP